MKTSTFGLAFFFVRLYVCAVFEGLIAGKLNPTAFYAGHKTVNKTQIPVGLPAMAPYAAQSCPRWKAKITACKDFMTKSTGKPHEIAFPLVS